MIGVLFTCAGRLQTAAGSRSELVLAPGSEGTLVPFAEELAQPVLSELAES